MQDLPLLWKGKFIKYISQAVITSFNRYSEPSTLNHTNTSVAGENTVSATVDEDREYLQTYAPFGVGKNND